MTLLHDVDNLIHELKNKKKTPQLREELEEKYKDLNNLSNKLFDKIFTSDNITSEEINIIKTMLRMKIQRDKGHIEKLEADKNIGKLLCKTYVEPMLKDIPPDKKPK
jgi:chromatin segregation and condensation protein Rec8/ScpA/Scc1 (kleisin family)